MTGGVAVLLAACSAAVMCGAPPVGSVRLGELAAPTGVALRSASLAPVGAGVLALLLAGPVAAVLMAGMVALARAGLARRRVERARAAERLRALDALSILGADLRAGRTPPQALSAAAQVAVGPTREGFAAAARAAAIGGDVAAVLATAESAVPRALAGLGVCWRVCEQTGAGL